MWSSPQYGSGLDEQPVRAHSDPKPLRRSGKAVGPGQKTPQWKYLYWTWRAGALWPYLWERIRAQGIDLSRTLIGGDGFYKDLSWREITSDMPEVSRLLADSLHVKFLEQYQTMGERLFERKNLEQTQYFQSERRWARLTGRYFGQQTDEGLYADARAFVTLYERIKNGDWTEVSFSSNRHHSPSGTLPVVRPTLTPGTVQIVEGHHRLAIAWVLEQRKARVRVVAPKPTELQSLVLRVAETGGQRRLCQPIDRPEFDSSWELWPPCTDRLAMILNFLAENGAGLERLSVANLGCAYGWFVAALSERGYQTIGVDPDPAALKIGRLAYGVAVNQFVQSDLHGFVANCQRTFDVVLLSGGLYDSAQKSDSRTLAELLQRVDSITGRYLFLDTAQTYERWWRRAFPDWNEEALLRFLQQNTSFSQVVRLGSEAKKNPSGDARVAGTLLACTRSC